MYWDFTCFSSIGLTVCICIINDYCVICFINFIINGTFPICNLWLLCNLLFNFAVNRTYHSISQYRILSFIPLPDNFIFTSIWCIARRLAIMFGCFPVENKTRFKFWIYFESQKISFKINASGLACLAIHSRMQIEFEETNVSEKSCVR